MSDAASHDPICARCGGDGWLDCLVGPGPLAKKWWRCPGMGTRAAVGLALLVALLVGCEGDRRTTILIRCDDDHGKPVACAGHPECAPNCLRPKPPVGRPGDHGDDD